MKDGLNIFSASWCGPCKMLKATLDSKEIPYTIVDVDEQSSLAASYNVRGVPTCIYVKDGVEKERFTGVAKENITRAEELVKNL